MCGFSPPFLWLSDAEYFRDGGGDVELHSDVVNFMVVFDPFPTIDDGDCCLHVLFLCRRDRR